MMLRSRLCSSDKVLNLKKELTVEVQKSKVLMDREFEYIARLEQLEKEKKDLMTQVGVFVLERENSLGEKKKLMEDRVSFLAETKRFAAEKEEFLKEKEDLGIALQSLETQVKERDELVKEKSDLLGQKETLLQNVLDEQALIAADLKKARGDLQAAREEVSNLKNVQAGLSRDLANLRDQRVIETRFSVMRAKKKLLGQMKMGEIDVERTYQEMKQAVQEIGQALDVEVTDSEDERNEDGEGSGGEEVEGFEEDEEGVENAREDEENVVEDDVGEADVSAGGRGSEVD